jgi:hypothetical protein
MSYSDIRSLPLQYRRWFISRLTKHFEEKKKSYDTPTSSSEKSTEPSNNFDMDKVNKFFSAKFKK